MPKATTHSPTAIGIAPALPGWTVTTGDPKNGSEITAPVIAWILTPYVTGPLGDNDRVEPVFVVDGGVWTKSEYDEIFSYGVSVNPPVNAL